MCAPNIYYLPDLLRFVQKLAELPGEKE